MKGKKMIRRGSAVALVAAAALVAVGLSVSDTETASAATANNLVFQDDFSQGITTDNWLKSDFVNDKDAYYSMRFDYQTNYGAAVLYKDYKVHDDCVISFDFKQSNVDEEKYKDNWFGVLFGYNDDSAHFRGGNAAVLSYGRGQTQLMDDGDGRSEQLVADSYNDHTKYPDSFVLAATDKTYSVEFVLTYTGTRAFDGANLYKVEGYYYEKGNERSKTPQIVYKGIDADGYFGFSAMASAVFDVSNVQIFEGGVLVAGDDFINGDGTAEKIVDGNNEEVAWKTINIGESFLYAYNNNRAYSDGKDGFVLSNYGLNTDLRNEKTFDISYNVAVEEVPVGAVFGFALGLSKTAISADEGELFGIEICDDGWRMVRKRGGENVEETETLPASLMGDKPFDVRLIGGYNGKIVMQACGYTYEFSMDNADGHFALAALGNARVCFDNVSVRQSVYVTSNSENMSNNFLGTQEIKKGNKVENAPYINANDWYLGVGVELPLNYRKNNMFVQIIDMDTSKGLALFGPKKTYSDFICRFTITVMQNNADAQNSAIGLCFGKEHRNDLAVNSSAVYFQNTNEGMILKTYNGDLQGADASGIVKQYEKYPQLNFWSSENYIQDLVTYKIMMVVRNGKAYVYYANVDDLSQMNECKAIVDNITTNGFVTVSAMNGANFRLKDFAITNIAPDNVAKTDVAANTTDTEYVNVDFSKEELYVATGEVYNGKEGISLGYNSSVTVKENFTDFLMYLDVNGLSGKGLEIRIGEDKIRLNQDGSVYSQMHKVYEGARFDMSAMRSGGLIMIEAVGTRITVGAVGAGLPLSLCEKPLAIYETEKRVSAVETTVSTLDETVLSLQSVRMYTLKESVAIATENKKEGEMARPDKKAPDSETQEDSGCGSLTQSVLPVMITACVGVVIGKRGRKDA